MPFDYACEHCGKAFTRSCRPNNRSAFRFCSIACKAAKQRGVSLPARQRIPRDRELLHHLYWDEGFSRIQIAERFNVSPGSIWVLFRKLGIPMRSVSEAKKLTMSRLTPEEREQGIAKAHASIRGRPKTPEFLHRRAEGIQRANKLSAHEAEVVRLLKEQGFSPVPLYAVDKYNIDIAFPNLMLGFEITAGGWHSTPRKVKADGMKARVLKDLGWTIVNLNHDKMPPAKAADQIIATLIR